MKAAVKPIDMAKGFSEAKSLFKDSFSAPPWNDDWSEEAKLVGLSFGRIIHFYEGTQYRVDEFCTHPAFQGKGYGSLFIGGIKRISKDMGVAYILLDTVKTYKAYSFYLKNGFEEIKDDVGLFLKLV